MYESLVKAGVPILVSLAPSTGGTPPLQSSVSTTVFVNLLDLNDNDPTFLNLPFVAEVPEGLPIGSSVFRVSFKLQSLVACEAQRVWGTVYTLPNNSLFLLWSNRMGSYCFSLMPFWIKVLAEILHRSKRIVRIMKNLCFTVISSLCGCYIQGYLNESLNKSVYHYNIVLIGTF